MLAIQSKKTDYNTKISEIGKKVTDHDHDKYISTPEYNKLQQKILLQDQHKQIQQAKVILIIL